MCKSERVKVSSVFLGWVAGYGGGDGMGKEWGETSTGVTVQT